MTDDDTMDVLTGIALILSVRNKPNLESLEISKERMDTYRWHYR